MICPSPPPGLWLHGFLGSGDDGIPLFAPWNHPAPSDILCPTLPGHGSPPQPPATLSATLDRIAALARTRPWAAGYSMGARLLMMAAARHPDAFHTLILESAALGYPDPSTRRARLATDEERAARLRRDRLPAFTQWWYTLPLWNGSSPPPPRSGDPEALADALTAFSTGRQPDMRTWLRSTTCRILWLAGSHDTAYAQQAEEVRRLAPRVHVTILPGAGHNVHHDQPAAWRAAVLDFLTQTPSQDQ